eukprot:761797-Hanusia_phi.AAC.1
MGTVGGASLLCAFLTEYSPFTPSASSLAGGLLATNCFSLPGVLPPVDKRPRQLTSDLALVLTYPNVEEDAADAEGDQEDDNHGEDRSIGDVLVVTSYHDQRTDDAGDQRNEQLPDIDVDRCNDIERPDAQTVPDEEIEGCSGCCPEASTSDGSLDVGVLVDEIKEAFKASQAAFPDECKDLDDLGVGVHLLDLVHVVAKNPPNHLDHCDDKTAKRCSA